MLPGMPHAGHWKKKQIKREERCGPDLPASIYSVSGVVEVKEQSVLTEPADVRYKGRRYDMR